MERKPKFEATDNPPQLEDDLKQRPADWVDRYGDRLFQYALRRVNSRETAEDLVQDTFLSAIRSGSFTGVDHVERWLITILRNKIIDHYRKTGAVGQEISLESLNKLPGTPFNSMGIWDRYVSNWARSPEDVLEDKQFMGVMRACFSKLPEGARRIFELKFLMEDDQKEICKVAGVSPSNYWVVMHRVRLALRECIEKNWVHRR